MLGQGGEEPFWCSVSPRGDFADGLQLLRAGRVGGRGKKGSVCVHVRVHAPGAEALGRRRAGFSFLLAKVSSCGIDTKQQSAKFEESGEGRKASFPYSWGTFASPEAEAPCSSCYRSVKWAGCCVYASNERDSNTK